MSKELVISANRHETRVAVLEDDQVVEVFYQRENEYSLAGSIHKGRVTRVLPGMQSAFVDIGLGRDAFLYVSDFFEDNDEYDKIVTSVEEKVLKLDRTPAPVVQAAPVEATAAPEAATAPAADAVAVPVDVPPAAPLSPPASAMQVPRDSRGTGGPTAEQDRGGDRVAGSGWETGEGDQGGDRRGRRSRRGRGQRRRRTRLAGRQILFAAARRGIAAPGAAGGQHSRGGSGGGSAAATARNFRPGAGRFLRTAGRIAGQVYAARRRGIG